MPTQFCLMLLLVTLIGACSTVSAKEEEKLETNVAQQTPKTLWALCEAKGYVHDSNITDMTSSGVYALSRGLSLAEAESSDAAPTEVSVENCKLAGFVDKAELEAELGATYVVSRTTTDDGRPGLTIYAKRVGL